MTETRLIPHLKSITIENFRRDDCWYDGSGTEIAFEALAWTNDENRVKDAGGNAVISVYIPLKYFQPLGSDRYRLEFTVPEENQNVWQSDGGTDEDEQPDNDKTS